MSSRFARLEDAILDPSFVEADLALRKGRHVGTDDVALYTFLVDAWEHLEPLYMRFGCELVHKAEGYIYLLPKQDRIARRQLRPVEMLVGQALALLYLDPRTVEQAGAVTREDVLGQLAAVVGTDELVRALGPPKRRTDARLAEEAARAKVSDALRRLAALGFAHTEGDGRLTLRPAVLRFAEPSRLPDPPDVTLARLSREGEIVMVTPEEDEPEQGEAPSDEDDPAGED